MALSRKTLLLAAFVVLFLLPDIGMYIILGNEVNITPRSPGTKPEKMKNSEDQAYHPTVFLS
jgi:hypothetical protein